MTTNKQFLIKFHDSCGWNILRVRAANFEKACELIKTQLNERGQPAYFNAREFQDLTLEDF